MLPARYNSHSRFYDSHPLAAQVILTWQQGEMTIQPRVERESATCPCSHLGFLGARD